MIIICLHACTSLPCTCTCTCIDIHCMTLRLTFRFSPLTTCVLACISQLIEELRTTHTLQAPEQKIKKQETEQIDKKKLQEKRLLHKVRLGGIGYVPVAIVVYLIIINSLFVRLYKLHQLDTLAIASEYFHTFTPCKHFLYILLSKLLMNRF